MSCWWEHRTLNRWLDKPAFSRAYRKARREAFSQAIALTQRYAPLAVNTLAKVMSDANAPASAKVAAAVGLLRFGREGIELDDLAARVEALEQAVAIVYNGVDGTPLHTLEAGGVGLGWAVRGAGDVNADGVNDLIVGAVCDGPLYEVLPGFFIVFPSGTARVYSGADRRRAPSAGGGSGTSCGSWTDVDMSLNRRVRALEGAVIDPGRSRCGTCGYGPGVKVDCVVSSPGESDDGPDFCPECGFPRVLRVPCKPLRNPRAALQWIRGAITP